MADAVADPRRAKRDRPIECRVRSTEQAGALGQGPGASRRVERAGQVAEAVLAELGDLDPGDDRRSAAVRRDDPPGVGGLDVASDEAEEPGPFGGDPGERPRRGVRAGSRPRDPALRRPADVGPPAGRPPGLVRPSGRRQPGGPALVDGCQRGVDAGEGGLGSPGPPEGPAETGQVAGRHVVAER